MSNALPSDTDQGSKSEDEVCLGWQGVQHRCTEAEVRLTLVEELCLQQPVVDVTELEDVRWFYRSWLRRHLHHVGACSF
jgi:hypothetical protein